MRLEPYLVSIAVNILKRMLEPHYDRLAWHRTLRQFRALPERERKHVEKLLYVLAAYLEVNITAQGPLGTVLKRLLEDAPSEIGSRLVHHPIRPAEDSAPRSSLLTSLTQMAKRATEHLERPLI